MALSKSITNLYRPCQTKTFSKLRITFNGNQPILHLEPLPYPHRNMSNVNYSVILLLFFPKWISLECEMTHFAWEHFDIICSLVFFCIFERQCTTAEKGKKLSQHKNWNKKEKIALQLMKWYVIVFHVSLSLEFLASHRTLITWNVSCCSSYCANVKTKWTKDRTIMFHWLWALFFFRNKFYVGEPSIQVIFSDILTSNINFLDGFFFSWNRYT